jgi:hypothetical protein
LVIRVKGRKGLGAYEKVNQRWCDNRTDLGHLP